MGTQLDFMQYLESDMALNIMGCLDDAADLIHTSSVSRLWRDFVITNGLCKQLCLKSYPQLVDITRVTESEIDKPADIGSSSSWGLEVLNREHRVYGALFKALTAVKVVNCIVDAISASSTDNYPSESIIYTLDPRERTRQRPSYWSSKGQKNPEVPETLIYKLRGDLCVITEINIRPFQAYFQNGHPIYSAKSVRFRMGHPKCPAEFYGCDVDWPLEHGADDEFTWTYTSEVFPMSQENVLQNFKLPEHVLCIGGYLQVELLGRVQLQELDESYYICVAHVQAMGRSLHPAFRINMFETSGKFTLQYDAEAFPRTLENVLPPSPSSYADVRAWGHLEGLGEFLMHRFQSGDVLFEEVEEDDEDDDNDYDDGNDAEWGHMLML